MGAAYSQSLSATGGTGGYTWSVSTGSLPAGLSLSSAGAISGTPTAPGTASFTVQVTDSANTSTTKPLSIAVAPAALSITTSSLPGGTVGASYSQSLSATGGTGGYTWSVSTGSLPAGLSLATTGAITGTPTASGTASFTVQATDSANTSTTKPLSIAIAPAALSITTSSLPGGTVGASYSQGLSATGGTGGYGWSIASGSLPSGLSLSDTGIVSGTPTDPGTTSFTVQLSDSANTSTTKPLSIAVAPAALNITTSSLPGGAVGTPYTQGLSATGGIGGYTWSTISGSLPAGLSLSASGSISGTPTAPGTASFTVQVTDGANASATKPLSITVNPPGLSITAAAPPPGTVGVAYQQTLSATGGTGPYTWSVTAGSLPPGLSLASNGAIGGTPTAAGTSSFTAQVTDSANATATQALSIAINPPPLTVATGSLPGATVGAGYQQALSATGGTGGFSWSTVSGALPAGLSLGSDGTIGGTPTATGASAFTVQVKDSSSAAASKALSITVSPALPPLQITTTSLLIATLGSAYSQSLTASGGTGAYTWSVTSGSLPGGLSLSASGKISGTPAQPGTSNFTVAVTDGITTSTRPLTLTVSAPFSISTSPLPAGTVGITYRTTLAANGAPPYTWTLASGQLPDGLTLNTLTGVILGTPTRAGTFAFKVQATDSTLATASADLTITIRTPLAITTASILSTGSAGAAYVQAFTAGGGSTPYSWSATGTLPAGLNFSATGRLTGTPTQVGSFPITVQVTDATSAKASAEYVVQIVSGLAIATPPVLPAATSGVPYSFTLQPAGGTPPYQWIVTSGSIPSGLTFTSAGLIGGTPTSSGTFNFSVSLTDGNSNTAQKAFTLTVAGPLSIASTTLPPGFTGAPYSQTLSASGGTQPYSWSVSAGSLPPGLILEAPTGLLTGTPTAAGNFQFTVSLTDANSISTQKQFALSIAAGLSITTPAQLPSATAGSAYRVDLAASGGNAPYSFSLVQGNLPAGLSLNGAAGTIEGTPTVAGTFNFLVQAADASNLTATRALTLTVGVPDLPAISITGVPGTLQPLQQPLVDVVLARPYPVPVTGTLNLAFTPSGSNPADDPAVQFSTGGRSATFTIPANTTHATFGAPSFGIQGGSSMGSIAVSVVSLSAAGISLPVPGGVAQTASVPAGPPVIRSLTLTRTSGGIQLDLVGLSPTRELNAARVTFQPASGTTIQNQDVLVPVADVAKAWFQDAQSAPFGSQFTLTLPFTFQGSVSISSVSVILVNGSGQSQAMSVNY